MRTKITILLFFIFLTLNAQKAWLAHIGDTTPLCRISLPGAHDAATGNGMKSLIKTGRTQSLTMSGQWDAGIRVFDLRPAVLNDDLHIYHGPLKTRLAFDDAIDILLGKIDENPTEFAIVIMRNEGRESEKWETLVGEKISALGERAATFHPELTAGEVRGRILFLSRDRYIGCSKGAHIEGWNHSLQGMRDARIVSCSTNAIARLQVQDFYALRSEEQQKEKLFSAKEYLQAADSAPLHTWTINHASGYSKTFFGFATTRGYKNNARYMNSTIAEAIGKLRCGIVMMDFAGDEKLGGKALIEAIIGSNFR